MWINSQIYIDNIKELDLDKDVYHFSPHSLSRLTNATLYSQELLREAQKKAEGIIDCARVKAQEDHDIWMIEQQETFLQRIDFFLEQCNQQRAEWEMTVVQQLRNLIQKTLKNIFSDLTLDQKLDAILFQLNLHSNFQSASLFCSSLHAEYCSRWVEKHSELGWVLMIDSKLDDDTLRLSVAQAEMSLSWQAFEKHFTCW